MSSDAPPADAQVDYRQLLEEERTDLRRQLAELGFGDGGGLSYDHNFADTSQVSAERSEAAALAGQLQDALAEVEAALGRLDEGTYGRCEACGKPIVDARLEAKPAARRCITCASRS